MQFRIPFVGRWPPFLFAGPENCEPELKAEIQNADRPSKSSSVRLN